MPTLVEVSPNTCNVLHISNVFNVYFLMVLCIMSERMDGHDVFSHIQCIFSQKFGLHLEYTHGILIPVLARPVLTLLLTYYHTGVSQYIDVFPCVWQYACCINTCVEIHIWVYFFQLCILIHSVYFHTISEFTCSWYFHTSCAQIQRRCFNATYF